MTDRLTKLNRYVMSVQAGEVWSEPADEGEWVRYEDILRLLGAINDRYQAHDDDIGDLLKGNLPDEPKAERCPVDGDLDERGVSWRLVTTEAVTPNELRAIASQIHAAATALENR